MCKEWEWESFRPTMLVEVEVAMLKYGSPLYFLKSSVRSIKEAHTHALARLAGWDGAKGASMIVRHHHE
jgi:hypothetical protein